MKKHCILILYIISCFTLNAQTTIKERKVVQIMAPQTFYLNGGTRAALGGKSRVWYNIELPKNTIEWYYAFSTARGKDSSTDIKLLSQLTRVYDPTGMTATAISALLTPTGAGVCDIYLMDRVNADKFSNKVDNWGGTYEYRINGSRLNFRNGVVQINDKTSGQLCLGFKNPSASEGIAITLEVAAIVEEVKVVEKTETETKAELFGNLAWKSYEKGEYDKCMELCKKALELNPKLGWVHNNIGLVQLIKGDYVSAIDSYSTAIILFKKAANPKLWLGEAIKHLNALIRNNGNIDGAKDIMELLQSEKG